MSALFALLTDFRGQANYLALLRISISQNVLAHGTPSVDCDLYANIDVSWAEVLLK